MSRSRSPSDTDRTCVDVDASSEHEALAKQPRVGEPEVDNHGFDMVTQGPRHWPAPATPPRRLDAYNDALRNIQRLIVEDRVFIVTEFPEGREDPCFIDGYQDEDDKWHCALAPWDGITAKNPEERREAEE